MGRNSRQESILTSELCVGDIIFLGQGALVPVSCLVIESNQLHLSEAANTGEPDEQAKQALTAENFP